MVVKEKEREKLKKFTLILIFLIFFTVPVVFLLMPKMNYSDSERRYLAALPEVSMKNLASGKFMEEVENYMADHFPAREYLRVLKGFFSFYILKNGDNNGLYAYDGYLAKMEYPLEEEMVEHALLKMKDIYKKYLENSKSKCYIAVIPDKNYYMASAADRLSMDYGKLFRLVKENTSSMTYIDLTKELVLEDFYKTDTHWRQEKIVKIAKLLGEKMGTEVESEYMVKALEIPFHGVYAGQWAMPVKGEKLFYLTNSILQQAKVSCLDSGSFKEAVLYDFDKSQGKDPYEIFLGGTKAILEIENKMAKTDKELLLFRDSFGSSLAPLLVPGYRKITLIDIRYVQSSILDQFIDFNEKDVLFLYSSLILNNGKAFR